MGQKSQQCLTPAHLYQHWRPGASRGQLKIFYPKYFKDILNLVCNFGFFGKALKLKMNII